MKPPYRRGKVWIGSLSFSILLFFSLFSFLFAQLDFQKVEYDRFFALSDNTRLPSAKSLAAIFLNYKTFAADLSWIQMVVDYGDRRSLGRKNVNILYNGGVISELDPQFRHLYDWVPGAFFASEDSPSLERMAQLSKLLERGQAAFPAEGRLSYDTAVNYLSSPGDEDDDYRKLANARIAIHYLKKAIKIPNTPELVAPLLSHFESQRANLINKYSNLPLVHLGAPWRDTELKKPDYKPNVDELAKFILSSTDPEIISNIRSELLRSSDEKDQKLIKRIDELSRTFEDRYKEDWRSFLPATIWSTLVE